LNRPHLLRPQGIGGIGAARSQEQFRAGKWTH
jgi:hypothetical protein